MNETYIPTSVGSAAEHLKKRYGAHVAALLAYGSRVCGQPRTGSAYDFWLIVKDPSAFHHDNAEFYRTELNINSSPEKQIALNRTGPLFYSLKEDDLAIKIAVLGEADFVRLCRDEWWTVKGRMQKPLLRICSTPAVDDAVLAARREGLTCGLNLVAEEFTMEQLLYQIVGLSYRAEIRPEAKGAKIRSIMSVGRAQLEAIYRPLLDELDYVEQKGEVFVDRRSKEDRCRARAETLRALRRSKWCRRSRRYIWRNFRSHGSPIRYITMKIIGELEKAVKRLLRK